MKYIEIENTMCYAFDKNMNIITMANAKPLTEYICPYCGKDIRFIKEYMRSGGVRVRQHFTHTCSIIAGKCTKVEYKGQIISQNSAEGDCNIIKDHTFKYIDIVKKKCGKFIEEYFIVLRDDRKFFSIKATEALKNKLRPIYKSEFRILPKEFTKDDKLIRYWNFIKVN